MSKWMNKLTTKLIVWLTGFKEEHVETVINRDKDLNYRRVEHIVPQDTLVKEKVKDNETKIQELLDIILDKFQTYKTSGYIENEVIKRLVITLLDKRQSRRNELDAEENELADSMNGLIDTLEELSKELPV